MPKTTKSGKPKREELPSTLQRSGTKAQKTFAHAHDSAAEQYGDAERARQGPREVLSSSELAQQVAWSELYGERLGQVGQVSGAVPGLDVLALAEP